MTDTFKPGELFVYRRAPGVYELGVVKTKRDERTYFCYYSMGDTAAATPVANMCKLTNAKWSPIKWARDGGVHQINVGDILNLIPLAHEVFITDGADDGMICRAVGVPDAFMGMRVMCITATEGCIDIEVPDV